MKPASTGQLHLERVAFGRHLEQGGPLSSHIPRVLPGSNGAGRMHQGMGESACSGKDCVVGMAARSKSFADLVALVNAQHAPL